MVKKNKRSNGRMRPVTVVTMASSFERRLAKQSDVTTLRGKLLLPTSTVTSTPAALLTGSPGNFGARASSLANIFSRFRIKTLNVKWTAVSTNAVGVVALGFYDDATSGEGQAPSDVNGILEMRCSSSFMTPTTIPQEFAYRPVDSKLWYATQSGSTGSDQRLVAPFDLYVAGVPGGSAIIEIDYVIVFKGAVDSSSI